MFSISKSFKAYISYVRIWYHPNYFNTLTLIIVKKQLFLQIMQSDITYTLFQKYVAILSKWFGRLIKDSE